MNILTRTPPRATHRLPYGELPLQFGDLWLPAAQGNHRFPVLVFVHGGWWKSEYSLDYAGELCQAMSALGVAVWSLEYRRVGDAGGGWPGTMQDVAAGFDFISKLAAVYPLDASRVVAAGHSAGGQLAFWLAGRHHIPHGSPLAVPAPALTLQGIVSLAGAVDLRQIIEQTGILHFNEGGPAVKELLGGSPESVPERYAAADPARLLPLHVPQILVQGTEDAQIPAAVPALWKQTATRQGDTVAVHMITGADHFDIVDPTTSAWSVTREALSKYLL